MTQSPRVSAGSIVCSKWSRRAAAWSMASASGSQRSTGPDTRRWRISSAPGEPPGSRVARVSMPRASSAAQSRAVCTVLPAPSPPSSVMKRPRVMRRRRASTRPGPRSARRLRPRFVRSRRGCPPTRRLPAAIGVSLPPARSPPGWPPGPPFQPAPRSGRRPGFSPPSPCGTCAASSARRRFPRRGAAHRPRRARRRTGRPPGPRGTGRRS